MTSPPGIAIELAHDSPSERKTRALLLDLMQHYPLDRWRYADRVRISDGEIPHSHPVLTLAGYADPVPPLGLLSSYIHEQLHWFWLLESHGERPSAAMEAFERAFPELPEFPVGPPDGCRSAFSNCLHVAINFWELEGLGGLIGMENARDFIANRPFYRAIYRLVLDRTDDIAAILNTNDLVVPATLPANLRFILPDR